MRNTYLENASFAFGVKRTGRGVQTVGISTQKQTIDGLSLVCHRFQVGLRILKLTPEPHIDGYPNEGLTSPRG